MFFKRIRSAIFQHFQLCQLILGLNSTYKMPGVTFEMIIGDNTVKLARAKLPANAGNLTCSSQVKKPHTQFSCITCSLTVKTNKYTCVDVASTSRRIHANCLQARVNLPEYHAYFSGNFTCGTHAKLPATSMQNFLLLQAKTLESQTKIPAKRRQK